MVEPLSLTNVLDDAAIFSLEHQLHLEEVLGDHNYDADLNALRFEFTGNRPLTCTGVHLIGSAAPGPRSWMWGWANPSGFPEALTGLSTGLRDFGERHGIAELTSPEVPFDALPGSPDEPPIVAALLTDVAKIVTGRWTSYTIPAGGGTRAAFLIEHPNFFLPPPEAPRVMRVIPQAIANLPLTDHRRAVHSYAVQRRLNPAFNPDLSKLTLTGPGLEAVLDFDQYGRVADINASMSPPRG